MELWAIFLLIKIGQWGKQSCFLVLFLVMRDLSGAADVSTLFSAASVLRRSVAMSGSWLSGLIIDYAANLVQDV